MELFRRLLVVTIAIVAVVADFLVAPSQKTVKEKRWLWVVVVFLLELVNLKLPQK